MNKRLLTLVIAGALVVPSASALAVNATTTFSPSATVVDSCSVTATDMGFGNVDPLATSPTTATSTISVTCSNGTAYEVGLNAGTATGATVTTRQMTSGTNTLNYGLYTDTGHTTNWDDVGGTTTQSATGNGTAQSLTVYGQVPVQATAATGTYTDTITVTVSY